MNITMHRNKSVNVHQFAMVPKAEVPRSTFIREFTHKTTFDENWLIPIYIDEVLPGDTFSLRMTAFARLSTPIYPLMDNLYLDSFFFFVPCRLLWTNWVRFMGEQDNPADSISYTVPIVTITGAGFNMGTLQDYMGLPTSGQQTAGTSTANALPLRAYNKIWNDWFRDENLQNSVTLAVNDGPDPNANYTLLKRGKRHDYFTSALPWTQKGGTAITLPLGTSAPVKTTNTDTVTPPFALRMTIANSLTPPGANAVLSTGAAGSTAQVGYGLTAAGTFQNALGPSNLYADLTQATAATINQLRQSFQIQKLLERDARGGTRYVELIRAHFGVVNPDFRLQRSEYLGGGTTPIVVNPIPQTAQTGLTGGTTPLGTLGGYATATAHGHGFTQSFTEHGYVIGLVNVRADVTYQQGLQKLWSRSTRYDFYFPAFAMLGEQAILNQEIYITGTQGTGASQDQGVFGYQERWAEYRYFPSRISGAFRSTYATPLDAWHLAEKFTALPTLSSTFIQSNAPVSRVIAANVTNTHFIFDSFFNVRTTRPMPLYSVPGLIDHF